MPNLFNDINDKQATLYNVNIAVNLKKQQVLLKNAKKNPCDLHALGVGGGGGNL